jgi:hypothetical protein
MKHVIIATTAINRPMLHSDNMVGWVDWIADLKDKDTSITWFINIDMVEKLESTYGETQTTFENMIKERIPTVFLSNPTGKGNFLEACKRLSINIVQHVENLDLSEEEQRSVKIIWLEDDWKLNPASKIACKDVIQNYTTNYSHTNLSFNRNNYIWALAPSIISYSLCDLKNSISQNLKFLDFTIEQFFIKLDLYLFNLYEKLLIFLMLSSVSIISSLNLVKSSIR